MRGLHVLLLGRPRLELDGQALSGLMPAKQQALVFHLAAEASPLPRSRAAQLLWGNADEAAARANLRVALSQLRRWLPGLLSIDARQIAFAPGAAVSVDLLEVEGALAAGSDWPLERRAAAAKAWRGSFLDGFALADSDDFERWAAQARQRAARSAGALRCELATACEAAGLAADAIAHARARIEIDDADEPAHMELMRLLAAQGLRTAALAQYEACRAALADRLGARPSADCYALYTRIHADAAVAPVKRPVLESAGAGPLPSRLKPPRGAASKARVGAVGSAVVEAPSAPPTLSATAAAPPTAAAEAEQVGAMPASPVLVGRRAELALLAERLADPACRWLTIVGPGGVGKTSLALAAAAASAASFRHGVLWLSGRDDGGTLRDADGVATQVLDRVGGDRYQPGSLLLVLDNLETVPEARALAQLLLARVPGLAVLATSRRRVAASREWLLELQGLSLAREARDRPASSDAARLLVAVARRLAPGFDDVAEADAVERVCALVGGLPLALEIAGRSARTLGVAAFARLVERGAPIADAACDAEPRHRSIAVVFDDSWAQLPAAARDAALRLAALPGEADLELAEAVGVDSGAIETLRDHSWLARTGGDRFAMHPLQHEYLRRRAEAAPHLDVVPALLVHIVERRLPRVLPFTDLAEADAATQLLAASASGSPPVLAEAARHLCQAADAKTAAMLPAWIDRSVAFLLAVGRSAEATALLAGASERADLPVWQAAGWRLRRAELLIGMGVGPGTFELFLRPLAQLGLRGIGDEADRRGDFAASLVGLLRRRDWPRDAAARRGLGQLVFRSLMLLMQLTTFAPRPRGLVRINTFAGLLASLDGGLAERQALRVSAAYGATYFGFSLIGRALLPPVATIRTRDADPRAAAHVIEGCLVARVVHGDWSGLTPLLEATARRCRAIANGRGETECLSIAAKLAFYEGRLAEAHERFHAIADLSLRRPGDAWRAWGPVGAAESGICLGTLDLPSLRALLDRAAQLMTELENIDNAYTLRRLGLESRYAWMCNDAKAAREALLAAVAAMSRAPRCGFWAHEGYAGIGDGLLRLREHEQRVGGALPPIDAARQVFDRALGRHATTFPAGRALVHRLRGQAAFGRGQHVLALRELRRAVDAAERQGLRVELARSCQALAEAKLDAHQAPAFAERATGLWRDMGVRGIPG